MVAVLVAVAAVALAVVLTRGGGGTPAGSTPTRNPHSAALADELVALLSRGSTVTYHARYVANATTPSPGSVVVLELWRTPQRLREDTTITAQGTVRRTAAFVSAARSESCVEEDGAWHCSAVTGPTPATLLDQVRVQAARADIEVVAANIAGHPAQCYTLVQTSGARSEVCLDQRGVPLRIGAGGLAYELQQIDDSVPDAVFTPPA